MNKYNEKSSIAGGASRGADMKMLKISLLIVGFLFSGLVSSTAQAECWVSVESGSNRTSSSLPYTVKDFLNAPTNVRLCSASGLPDGDYVHQAVYFTTPELYTGNNPNSNSIINDPILLEDVMRIDMRYSALIGNQSQEAIGDSSISFNEGFDTRYSDEDYSKDASGNVKDLGMVIIDARGLGAGINPINCAPGTANVYLRNTVIITDGVEYDAVFSECVKNAGNTHVCAANWSGGDPRTDADWCPFVPAFQFPGRIELTDTESNSPVEAYRWWYRDSDGDGFGDAGDVIRTSILDPNHFSGPSGYVLDNQDCDDAEVAINPSATDNCDNMIDDNCDGIIDGVTSDFDLCTAGQLDADGDGHCPGTSCLDPSDIPGDCDDSEAAVNPSASEICDGLDNDCNGVVDGTTVVGDFCPDNYDHDGDTYCEDAVICYDGANTGDCDDSDPTLNPGMTEICDTIDNNCDGVIDGTVVDGDLCALTIDNDLDGYCEDPVACTDPSVLPGDCDDSQAVVNPGGTEVCDGLDNDCNGVVDGLVIEGDLCPGNYDNDGDGYCEDAVVCYGSTVGDCDDSNDAVFPGALEVCDSFDNDCDGVADGLTTDGDLCGGLGDDLDGDGYCDGSICVDPSTQTPGDCDDTDPSINPIAIEFCDGFDNNCDSVIDEDSAVDANTFYEDLDGDGFGNPLISLQSCDASIVGYVDNGEDCDDTEVLIVNCGQGEGQGPLPESECRDLLDNDSDGLFDCADDGCSLTVTCNSVGEGFGAQPEVECQDGLDNDNDGHFDCDDVGCRFTSICKDKEGQGPDREEECLDGLDNDNDGVLDCQEVHCRGTLACNDIGEGVADDSLEDPVSAREQECSDLLDNDNDGLLDCADPECVGSLVCDKTGEGLNPEQDPETICSDKIDNDQDGLLDCNDPGCSGTVVCDKQGEGLGEDREATCSDDIDNDADGFSDCLDPGCYGSLACNVPGEGLGFDVDREEDCSDGLDNDFDGLFDCAEPSCVTTVYCIEQNVITPNIGPGGPNIGGTLSGTDLDCSLNTNSQRGSSWMLLLLVALMAAPKLLLQKRHTR